MILPNEKPEMLCFFHSYASSFRSHRLSLTVRVCPLRLILLMAACTVVMGFWHVHQALREIPALLPRHFLEKVGVRDGCRNSKLCWCSELLERSNTQRPN